MAIVINGSGTVTGISVGGLPDDIVDAGTLANDAVGLAQMAGGTDGNIITYDTSGNPAVVATGSDGQILTSAGADAVPAFETVAAGLSSQYVAFTRDSSSGAGTSSVTGVGFQPTAVLFLAAISGAGMASIGFEDSDMAHNSLVDRQLMTADDWDVGAWNARPINIVYASTVNYDGRITSYDADGFTLTWSVRGSPSGTISIKALCFK